jgi:hypothetical protein
MKLSNLSYCYADCKYWPKQDGPECPNCKSRLRAVGFYKSKLRVRRAVREAIKTGQLIKPKKCEQCDKEKPLEAHHKDYKYPLDVQWVCRKCHQKIHIPEY